MSRTAVEQIKERLSIVDVVGSYVELTRAGKNYKARSPFTNEKTPSFYVSPDRGMYYCFSSQQGGDMFTFVEKMEGVDFKGALKILAERAHVELVPEDPKKRDERDTQYALIEEATQYFFKQREDKPEVRAYIADRGVNTQSVHAWRIGYAPDEWRALRSYLTGKGFTDAEMLRAGLIKSADGGKEPYDVFRDRIMFPIFDASGRVVAFSGRTLKKEDGIPKYVNSPETELFQKSEILYGYDKAKQGIRHYDFSLLVEGQFDLVLSHQAGYTNAVAVSGTAFTAQHLALLERLSSRIVLALDSDRAGVTAVKRIVGGMLDHGMDVKVARMEGGKDPADIIKANPTDFKHFIGNAVHVVEFLLSVLKEGMKDERTYKLRVREELVPLLLHMQNRIDREHFEQVIGDAIGTTKDAVHFEVGRLEDLAKRDTHVAVKTDHEPEEPVLQKTRRETLEERIRATSEVCIATYPWLHDAIHAHVRALVDAGVSTLSLDVPLTPVIQAHVFSLEEQVEGIKEKQLIEDVEDMLTEYTHAVAREHLRVMRNEIQETESSGDDTLLISLLTRVRESERLLQTRVTLKR